MKILVCVKQVPGTSDVEVDPVTGVLKRDGVESKLNPYDLYALELALQLCERYGGQTATVTMGPPQARAMIEETLMMGVNGGMVLSDRRFAGADVLATSYALAQGLRRQGQFDLVLCGKQTTDGDTAQVGPEIAAHLGIPHVTNVEEILAVTGDSVTLRSVQDEFLVTQTVQLPCLLCTEGSINTPRLPSYRRKKNLHSDQVTILSLDDMEDTNEKHYGLSGSPTQVVRIFPPQKTDQKELWQGTSSELSDRLYHLLGERKFIGGGEAHGRSDH